MADILINVTAEQLEDMALNGLKMSDVEQTYDPNSTNAISGQGVAEALKNFTPSENGEQIDIDDAMSDTSTNPVQNKVAKAYVDEKTANVEKTVEEISRNFDVSVNLYNEKTNIPKKVVSATTGELVDNNQYVTTDFIYLKKGQYAMTYITDQAFFSKVARYNLQKEFISRSEISNGSLEITEDCYVRFSGFPARMVNKNVMLVEGTELPTEYVPYKKEIKVELVPTDKTYNPTSTNPQSGISVAEAIKQAFEEEANSSLLVSVQDTDFIKTSSNLINQMTIEKNRVINPSGEKVENISYHVTDKIYLKTATEYTCLACFKVSYFDKEDKYIQYQGLSDSRLQAYSFTTPDDFDYAIISLYYNVNIDYKWQINEGSELLPYEPQHLIINGYRLYDEPDVDEPDVEIDPIEEFVNKDRTVFDKSPLFVLDEEVTVYPGIKPTDQSNIDAIYGYYDELMSNNPLYITKTEMGADSQGNMLYRYDFKNPDQYHVTSKYSTEKPKVILISGIHFEQAGIYSLYNTMKEITNNPKLKDLKNDIHFIVVPLVNLYGAINGTRKNANGVDLARNFEIGWGSYPPDRKPTANTYCGTAPLTELECQYIDTILRDNADAIFFVSCHSFQISNEVMKDFIWATVNSKYSSNLGEKLIVKLSQEWANKYDIIATTNGYIDGNPNNKYIGISDVSSSGGTEGNQASKYGIHGGVLEVCDYFHFPELRSQHLTPFVISRGTETYINWILLNVYNYDTNF